VPPLAPRRSGESAVVRTPVRRSRSRTRAAWCRRRASAATPHASSARRWSSLVRAAARRARRSTPQAPRRSPRDWRSGDFPGRSPRSAAAQHRAATARAGAGGEVAEGGAQVYPQLRGNRAHRLAGRTQRQRGGDTLAPREVVLGYPRRQPGVAQPVAPCAEVVDDRAGARPARVLGQPPRRTRARTHSGRGPLMRTRRPPEQRGPVAHRGDDGSAVPSARVNRADLARQPCHARAPDSRHPRHLGGHARHGLGLVARPAGRSARPKTPGSRRTQRIAPRCAQAGC